MDRSGFLVFVISCLLCYCAAKHSEITVTLKDAELPDSNEEKPSNPIADLGVLMRNLFTVTNKLRSNIRTSTGFNRHLHSTEESGHLDTQTHDRHADRDRTADRESEPILEKLFDPHKRKEHSRNSPRKNGCKNKSTIKPSKKRNSKLSPLGRRPRSPLLERSPVDGKRVIVSIPSESFKRKYLPRIRNYLAHAENLTDEEDPIHLLWLKQSAAWVVRGRDERTHTSDMPEIEEVFRLNSDPTLPPTYYELKHNDGKEEPTALKKLLDGAEPLPTGKGLDSFLSRKLGKAIKRLPKETLATEPYSSIGVLKEGDCTGTFIGPRHILTAAHCIYQGKKWRNAFDFSAAKFCDLDEGVSYEWDKVIIPDRWFRIEDPAYDYGMIVVKSETPKHTVMNFGWGGADSSTKVILAGYLADDPKHCMWQEKCVMFGQSDHTGSPGLTQHSCDIGGGGGSPIFTDDSEHQVIRCIDQEQSGIEGNVCLQIGKIEFSSLAHWIERY